MTAPHSNLSRIGRLGSAGAMGRTMGGSRAIGCLAAAGAAVAAIGFASTDKVLESSYSAAVLSASTADNARVASSGPAGARIAGVSGSEDFWLGRLPTGARPASWSVPLSAGDRFIMGTDGSQRRLTVLNVRESAVSVDQHDKPVRLLLVECRDEAMGPDAPAVRLIMDDALAASLKAGAALPRTL